MSQMERNNGMEPIHMPPSTPPSRQTTPDDQPKRRNRKKETNSSPKSKRSPLKRRIKQQIKLPSPGQEDTNDGPGHINIELPEVFQLAQCRSSQWLVWMFEYLHASRTAGWAVPPTVVYTGTTTLIYLSDAEGYVEKVTRKRGFSNEFVIDTICGPPGERTGPGQIAAYFVSRVDGFDEGRLQSQYFDVQGVENFVKLANKTGGGILQKFQRPAGQFNALIRAWWTPHMLRMEARHAHSRFEDKRVSMQRRGATFESGEYDVTCMHIPTGNSRSRFAGIIQQLLNTVEKLLPKDFKLTVFVVYFKMLETGELSLLYCSVGRVQQLSGPGNPSAFQRPPTVQSWRGGTGKHKCPSCHVVSRERQYKLRVSQLLAHFMRHGTSNLRPGLGTTQLPHPPSWAGDRQQHAHASANLDPAENAVYNVLLGQFPQLTKDDFVRKRQDGEFESTCVLVCEPCCIAYSDTAEASLLHPKWTQFTDASSASSLAMKPIPEKPIWQSKAPLNTTSSYNKWRGFHPRPQPDPSAFVMPSSFLLAKEGLAPSKMLGRMLHTARQNEDGTQAFPPLTARRTTRPRVVLSEPSWRHTVR